MPDPSPSNADSPTSYSSEEGVVADHSGQFTPGGYLSTVIDTTLAGIKPTTWEKSSGVLRKKYSGSINEDCVPWASSDKPRSQANTQYYFVF